MTILKKSIGVYSGKYVRIITPDNKVFEGFISEYVYADDNESGNESIIMDSSDGRLIEFEETDIKEIVVLDREQFGK